MRALVLTGIAALLSAASPAPPLGLDAFRNRLIAAIHKANNALQVVVVDPKTLRIGYSDKDSLTLAVENAYSTYLQHPDDLDQTIARWSNIAATTAGGDGVSALDAPRLVVVARPTGVIANPKLANSLAYRPLGGDLIAVLAFDSPDALRYATVQDVKKLGIALDDAFLLAFDNSKKRAGPISMGRVEGETPSVSAVSAESGLASALLVDGTFCGGPNAKNTPGFHALMVDRNTFAFAIESDPGKFAAFRAYAARRIADADAISHTPIVCVGGKWVVQP